MNKIDKLKTTNLSFLTAKTGEPYLYVFNFYKDKNHIEAYILLEKEDVEKFFLQNNLPVPKIKKIAIEDLDDIKIIRQLENMEMFDEMVEREGRILECELNVEICFVRCVV